MADSLYSWPESTEPVKKPAGLGLTTGLDIFAQNRVAESSDQYFISPFAQTSSGDLFLMEDSTGTISLKAIVSDNGWPVETCQSQKYFEVTMLRQIEKARSLSCLLLFTKYDVYTDNRAKIMDYLFNKDNLRYFLDQAYVFIKAHFPNSKPILNLYADPEAEVENTYLMALIPKEFKPGTFLNALSNLENDLEKIGFSQFRDIIGFDLRAL